MNKNEKWIIREDKETNKTYLDFYAVVFNHQSKNISEDGVDFFEVIESQAFDNCDMSNVIATLYHDRNKIIGRTRADTLKLSIDEKGLKASVLMGDTQLHRDTLESVKRGDLDECSFIASVDDWEDKEEDGEIIRYIKNISILKDVSIVSEGAYSDTNIKIITRSYDEKNKNDNTMSNEEKIKELELQIEELKKEDNPEEVEREEEKPEDKEEKDKKETDEKPEEKEVEAEAETEEDKETEEEVERADDKPEEEKEDKDKKEVERSIADTKNKNNNKNMKNDLIKEVRRALTLESKTEIKDITRAAGDGASTSFTKLTPTSIAQLDVVGKEPIWAEMGVNYMPGCRGTVILPYENPIVAAQLAELASTTKQLETDLGTVVVGKRYSVQKIWTLETLSALTDEGLTAQINNLRQSIDRKITADVFNAVFAGAQAVASVTVVNEAGLDNLAQAADIETPYSFVMARSMFYNKKSVKVDAGSGVNLLVKDGKFGKTFDGDKVYFSALSPVVNKIAGGDMTKITVLDYDNEMIVMDTMTKIGEGQVVMTIVKIAAVALTNPNAFSVSGVIA